MLSAGAGAQADRKPQRHHWIVVAAVLAGKHDLTAFELAPLMTKSLPSRAARGGGTHFNAQWSENSIREMSANASSNRPPSRQGRLDALRDATFWC